MATFTKAEHELLSLAIRTIGDIERHATMPPSEFEALEWTRLELLALYNGATVTDTEKGANDEPA